MLDTCIVRTCGSVVTISAAQPSQAKDSYRDDRRDRITQIFFFQSLMSLSCSFSPYIFLLFNFFFFWFGFTIYMFLFLVKEIPNEERKADQRRFEMLNSCILWPTCITLPQLCGYFLREASLKTPGKVPTPPLE